MLVSVIVPAYNQAKTIRKDILNIYDSMVSTNYDFEIIVVDDGSTDETFKRVKSIEKERLKATRYLRNMGKGYAVKHGMKMSKGDLVAFIDSGMDINANGISMIIEHMKWYDADIVVGSKRHPASKVLYPPIRKLYSFGVQMLVKLLFRIKIRDTQTGLKVFKRKVLEDVLPRLTVKKFAFDIELIAVADYLGYKRIFEAPVEITKDFRSKSVFQGFLFFDPYVRSFFYDMLGVFYRMYILKYYANENRKNWIKD